MIRTVQLDDKYRLTEGRVFLSGLQALVRIPFDQRRADAAAGLNTATLVSGYQGSPLGGLDQELARRRALADEHHVVLRPGLNEELAATSVWGTQLVDKLPGARYDGVTGIWYGKAPGVDRAADALRHGSFVGAHRHGGLVALAGDDPACKSSTLPSASEALLASLHMPVLYPGDVQEALDFGHHAIACSRASGTWVGLKIVTAVADGTQTVEVAPWRPRLEGPLAEARHVPSARLLAPNSLAMERELFEQRLPLAVEYAAQNGLNRIVGRGTRLGIVAAGRTWFELRQAMRDCGLTDADLDALGIRLLKLGMLFPLERELVRRFAAGLEEILVIEEKRGFLEDALRATLYGTTGAPRIVGKRDELGAPLVPETGEVDADLCALTLDARIGRFALHEGVAARANRIEQARRRIRLPEVLRTPFFCSGCPHNRSTDAPDDAVVGLGIGCHTMVLINDRDKGGTITGITQMGGEGAQWIGMAPFTDSPHLFQNLGDGTFHHSGSLAIRAAVAARVNITYKLLYNSAVAMTGGQRVEGGMAIPDLLRVLEAEGVKRVIITTEDVGRYRGVKLPAFATVRDRRRLLDAQRELAAVEGVTVLIHDQECAAEKRRKRKRDKAAPPAKKVVVNERVCEGCGDCGQKSDCLSVQPVETEFGRKTRIHQPSCNSDYSCLEGDCPSFVTVHGAQPRKPALRLPAAELPAPAPRFAERDEVCVRMVGIGGTGVVTVNQILAMAALLEGKFVRGLDSTGLSQKGGPVVSDLRVRTTAAEGSGRAELRGVDCYLGLDLLGAADPRNLATVDPERTIAVLSTAQVPTGAMVVDPEQRMPQAAAAVRRVGKATAGQLTLDAQALAEALFGDNMPANVIVLGAAAQLGALPVAPAALAEAIRINGAAVEANLAAFAWGRAAVAAPGEVAAVLGGPAERADDLDALLALRVADLRGYQHAAYAADYELWVRSVHERETAVLGPDASAIARAAARGLHKLMAYKDEYEVARLHLAERARLKQRYGDEAELRYHLHPPALRALGLERKLELGRSVVPGFRALARMKRLRGTRLDPFGRSAVRRVERALIGEYRALVEAALERLRPGNAELVEAIAELPELVRGYEDIKLAAVERFRAEARRLTAELERPAPVAAGAVPLVVVRRPA